MNRNHARQIISQRRLQGDDEMAKPRNIDRNRVKRIGLDFDQLGGAVFVFALDSRIDQRDRERMYLMWVPL